MFFLLILLSFFSLYNNSLDAAVVVPKEVKMVNFDGFAKKIKKNKNIVEPAATEILEIYRIVFANKDDKVIDAKKELLIFLNNFVDNSLPDKFDDSTSNADLLNIAVKWTELLKSLAIQECNICRESSFSSKMFNTSCGHYFHATCLTEALNASKNRLCPNCRTSIKETPLEAKDKERWGLPEHMRAAILHNDKSRLEELIKIGGIKNIDALPIPVIKRDRIANKYYMWSGVVEGYNFPLFVEVAGIPPLAFAASLDKVEAVKVLLNYGANSLREFPMYLAPGYARDYYWYSAGDYAEESSSHQLCKLFDLANPNLSTERRHRSVTESKDTSLVDTSLLALKKGIKAASKLVRSSSQSLIDAIRNNNIPVMVALLRRSVYLHEAEPVSGFMPLHCAVDTKNVELMKAFLHAAGDIDMNVRDEEDGITPLHLAAKNSLSLMIQALLDADQILYINEVCMAKGWTALHYAADNGDVPSVAMLLDYGAHKKLTDKNNDTPYDIAAKKYPRNEALLNLLRFPR